jgi:WD40 repeat protein
MPCLYVLGFVETINLRNVKGSNLNYSCNDVVWSHLDPTTLATAATNGAIIVWNIAGTGAQKQKHIDMILNEHKRIVNKINFHPAVFKLLASGSQDGSLRLFDLRAHSDQQVAQMTFSQTESVRDIAWNPHVDNQIAAVSENGQVQLWDIRRYNMPELKWSAHTDHIYTCDWNPDQKSVLATAGRDKCIKIWDTSCTVNSMNTQQPEQRHTIYAMDAVSKVHWRPQVNQIASISLMSDFAIHVWDLQRPYVPFASFTEHTDIPTSFLWRGEPHTLVSLGKDNRLYQHAFTDAKRPALQANPIAMSFNAKGDLLYSFRDGRTQEIIPSNMNTTKQPLFNSSQASTGSSKISLPAVSKVEHIQDNIQKLSPLSQKSLQAYFERVANNSQELFRNNSSYMVQINSSVMETDRGVTESDAEDSTNDHISQDEDDETHFLTNQTYIKYTAKNYRYTGMPFTKICDHNSKIASSVGRFQLATAWQVLKSVYLTDEELVLDLITNESNNNNGENTEMRGLLENKIPHKNEDQHSQNYVVTNSPRSIEPSLKKGDVTPVENNHKPNLETLKDTTINRDLSRITSETASATKRQTRPRKRSVRGKTPNDSSQESSDDCDVEYNDTLTNIASGHMLSGSVGRGLIGGNQDGDFFGDMENAILYRFDNLNPNNFPIKSEPDFSNLPTEAFEYRRELPNESLENAQASWQRHGNSSEAHLSQNLDGKDDQAILQTTVTVVNSNVDTLCVDMELADQIDNEAEMWNPDNILLENLEYYSNLNDVQTTVAMYLVTLGRMKSQRLVNSHIICHWFSSYIDQLQQMKLYTEANEIIGLCPLNSINSQTTRSTFIRTYCGYCGKLIETNRITSNTRAISGRCKKCYSPASTCAICHKPVNGLYAWCQGCGHGGHLDHISDWLKENKKCPFGCGHRCEYD